MTTLLDLLYVALFAVAFPLWDYFVFWPAFHRQSQSDPARVRTRLRQVELLRSAQPSETMKTLLVRTLDQWRD